MITALHEGWRRARIAHECTLCDSVIRAGHYVDDDGVSALATPQVRVTPRGLQALRELLAPQALEVSP